MKFFTWQRFSALVAFLSSAALFSGCGKSSPSAGIAAELAYQRAEGIVLGEYLAAVLPGARCVIVKAPELRTEDGGRAAGNPLVEGIKAGMGDKLVLVAELELPMDLPPKPEKDAPVAIGLPAEENPSAAFTALLDKGGEFALLIVCTPLPQGIISPIGAILHPALKGKKLALAAGYTPMFRRAVERGAILAAVTTKDDALFDGKPCPDDVAEAFDMRYELLTATPAPRTETQPEK